MAKQKPAPTDVRGRIVHATIGAGKTALYDAGAIAERVGNLILEMQAHGTAPYAPLLPPRVAAAFRVFVMSLGNTHPLVHRVVWEAATGDVLALEEDRGVADDEKLARQIVRNIVAQVVPRAAERKLEERAKSAVEEAQRTFAPDGPLPRQLHAWKVVVCALCVDAIALGPVEAAAAGQAFANAADLVDDLDDDAPTLGRGPAPTLLARIVSEVSQSIVLDYLRAVRSAASPAAAPRSRSRAR